MTRLEANRIIIEILNDYVQSNPDIRFGQALYNLGIATHKIEVAPEYNETNKGYYYRDIFFEESETTLNKLKQ